MQYLAIVSVILTAVTAVNRVVIKGSKLFDSVTKQQFFIKGVAYQPRNIPDPLADIASCNVAINNFKSLGVNVIRVYEAYSHANHDECMKALDREGIYVLLDLSVPSTSINREFPFYDTELQKHYFDKVDAFAKYPNILAFIAGNEITNDEKTTKASAYVKAVLRDTKAYVKKKGLNIPVGYADNDDDKIRRNIQDFFNCGTEEERADFYAINTYRWCGNATFTSSGYNTFINELKTYDKPTFLSEYGCNLVRPRKFSEIRSIYGQDMQDVLSGGVVYEYSDELNSYGLVRNNNPLPEFYTVSNELRSANPKQVTMDSYQPTGTKRQCPMISESWKSGSKLPPIPDEAACQRAFNALECRVTPKALDPSSGESIGKEFSWICNNAGLCDDIAGDPETGVYGKFSMCSPQIKNSIVFNNSFKRGTPCEFNGLASTTNWAPLKSRG